MYQDIAFYILWALFFVCIAPFIFLYCDSVIGKIIGIAFALAITFGIAVSFWREDDTQRTRWNDGICECGGIYEFSGAAKTTMSTTYYYTCDTCGHTEEFDGIMR